VASRRYKYSVVPFTEAVSLLLRKSTTKSSAGEKGCAVSRIKEFGDVLKSKNE
jgi:hypothetical protein